jgi:hypothetical protein
MKNTNTTTQSNANAEVVAYVFVFHPKQPSLPSILVLYRCGNFRYLTYISVPDQSELKMLTGYGSTLEDPLRLNSYGLKFVTEIIRSRKRPDNRLRKVGDGHLGEHRAIRYEGLRGQVAHIANGGAGYWMTLIGRKPTIMHLASNVHHLTREELQTLRMFARQDAPEPLKRAA